MKQRLQTLLATEKMASSKFADIIGVNRSSISHLLSGRNNPSLDFFQKVLVKFPHINPDWLLLGQGSMYRNNAQEKSTPLTNQIPFEEENIVKDENKEEIIPSTPSADISLSEPEKTPEYKVKIPVKEKSTETPSKKQIERIVFFYSDRSFDTYFPNT